MRFHFLLGIILFQFAAAYDANVSVYTGAAPLSILNPGVGIEYSTALGKRLVVGAGIGFSEPLTNNERAFLTKFNGRILYSLDIESYAYPMAEVNWSSALNAFEPWLGVGYQRNLGPAMGIYTESTWKPNTTDFQMRFGFRLWLERLSTLDSRAKHSNPLGVTYTGGPRRSAASEQTSEGQTSVAVNVPSSEPAPLKEPMMSVEPELVIEPMGDSSTVKLDTVAEPLNSAVPLVTAETENVDSQKASEIPEIKDTADPAEASIPEASEDLWYLHLGLFNKLESLQRLEFDPRLKDYQGLLKTIFDKQRGVFRLLVGPYKRQSAEQLKQTLKDIELDSFLYQLK